MRCGQIQMLEPRKDDMRSEVGLVCQSLLGCEEPKTFCAQIGCRETRAIVAMLQDNANPIGGIGQPGYYAFLQVWQPESRIVFTTLQDYDRTPGLVLGRIEEVSQIEGSVRVRLVLRLVEEVVDGNRDIMGRIQVGWVDIACLQSMGRRSDDSVWFISMIAVIFVDQLTLRAQDPRANLRQGGEIPSS